MSDAGTRDHRYHHGDLPNALRRAAADVIVERGLGAFSLREVARRAGVSHNAPAHHFGDTTGLLTSLAVEGFEYLHAALSDARHDGDPADSLVDMGRAYVQVGVDRPAHCEVMFRADLVRTDDPALQAAGLAAYTALYEAVERFSRVEVLELDVDVAAKLLWSSIEGLLVLHDSMLQLDELAGRQPASRDQLVERFTRDIVAGWRATGVTGSGRT